MQKNLTIKDIKAESHIKIYFQQYHSVKFIQDVKIINLKNNIDEEGDFCEILRLGNIGEVEQLSGFTLKQINRTKIYPQGVKAWHIHFKQDELWYVIPPSSLLVGLWDLRKKSKTSGLTQRIVLGGDNSQLLLIPRGVAHGSANFLSHNVEIYYFVNQYFNPQNPDEGRIPWNSLGKDFWAPKRD